MLLLSQYAKLKAPKSPVSDELALRRPTSSLRGSGRYISSLNRSWGEIAMGI
jgi:hypothetical protein